MANWLCNNIEWIFSGVGVAIIMVLIGRKKIAGRKTSVKTNIIVKGNKGSSTSFNGANFGIIANKGQEDENKEDD